jgi:hypothetical protein
MQYSIYRLAILLLIFFFSSTNTQAQHLKLNLINGDVEELGLAEVRSIKFDVNSLIIYRSNGNVLSWNIGDIEAYKFDLTTAVPSDYRQDFNSLKIFPNPASDVVQIEYTGVANRNLLIEILDSNGKLVEELYRGIHMSETMIRWDAANSGFASGIYFCKVSTGTKTITGKLILQ